MDTEPLLEIYREKKFKVVTAGSYSIGKTSLIMSLLFRDISELESTIGASFLTFSSAPGKQLQIWDTSGSERYRSLLPMYFRNSHAIIYCWPLDQSFDKEMAEEFLEIIQKTTENQKNKPLIFFVGTKGDAGLKLNRREFSPEEYKDPIVEDFVKDYNTTADLNELEDRSSSVGVAGIFYTSAKNRIGVKEAFDKITAELDKGNFEFPDGKNIKLENRFNFLPPSLPYHCCYKH